MRPVILGCHPLHDREGFVAGLVVRQDYFEWPICLREGRANGVAYEGFLIEAEDHEGNERGRALAIGVGDRSG